MAHIHARSSDKALHISMMMTQILFTCDIFGIHVFFCLIRLFCESLLGAKCWDGCLTPSFFSSSQGPGEF
jgi:hypothetical protein